MAKGDPKKPKGKMSAYSFFVQTCREEHKKKNPETMSGKEKSKFDEMAKADKVRYDREMKDYGPAKGGKKKDPNAPKRPPSGFFLFCSEFRPKIKSANPGISIGDVAMPSRGAVAQGVHCGAGPVDTAVGIHLASGCLVFVYSDIASHCHS
uniref:HMG box domain-containing protein n=1 Tax=Bos mutus grunniens TaxID=30521 RepID=A0A8C0ADE1_BOSMU